MDKGAMLIFESYLEKCPFMRALSTELQMAIDLVEESLRQGRKLLLCGNGGSNADADHIAGELLKGFLKKRPLAGDMHGRLSAVSEEGIQLAAATQGSLPAINLGGQTSLMTAVINDLGGEYIFSQQVMGLGNPGDILFAISTSGNSANIINAAIMAKAKELKIIGLTGQHGGKLRPLCDCCICVPSRRTPDIQDMHTSVYHMICAAVEADFWDE